MNYHGIEINYQVDHLQDLIQKYLLAIETDYEASKTIKEDIVKISHDLHCYKEGAA